MYSRFGLGKSYGKIGKISAFRLYIFYNLIHIERFGTWEKMFEIFVSIIRAILQGLKQRGKKNYSFFQKAHLLDQICLIIQNL